MDRRWVDLGHGPISHPDSEVLLGHPPVSRTPFPTSYLPPGQVGSDSEAAAAPPGYMEKDQDREGCASFKLQSTLSRAIGVRGPGPPSDVPFSSHDSAEWATDSSPTNSF